jgi:four helix bundle protein
MKRLAKRVQDLEVYGLAFKTAMKIFEITKEFPNDDKYSLTDQVRRSSRSVCANLAEGWRKRRYKAVFVNKLLDAAQEAAESQVRLEFAKECDYIGAAEFQDLYERYEHTFAMLNNMEKKAEAFCE